MRGKINSARANRIVARVGVQILWGRQMSESKRGQMLRGVSG